MSTTKADGSLLGLSDFVVLKQTYMAGGIPRNAFLSMRREEKTSQRDTAHLFNAGPDGRGGSRTALTRKRLCTTTAYRITYEIQSRHPPPSFHPLFLFNR
ncbi:MAG: hypothetical protein SD837_18745 [Candidatus Electrothrix scaldis]|nr:MAG: hypothetical protein SD837_18745 [Candidatus Electrothrix sp. GW3-3]